MEIKQSGTDCQNVFKSSDRDERTASFTRLWVNVINKKESSIAIEKFPIKVLQTKSS